MKEQNAQCRQVDSRWWGVPVREGPDTPLWTQKPLKNKVREERQGWGCGLSSLKSFLTQPLLLRAQRWVPYNPPGHQPMDKIPAALGRMVPPEMRVPLEPQNGREGLCRFS